MCVTRDYCMKCVLLNAILAPNALIEPIDDPRSILKGASGIISPKTLFASDLPCNGILEMIELITL